MNEASRIIANCSSIFLAYSRKVTFKIKLFRKATRIRVKNVLKADCIRCCHLVVTVHVCSYCTCLLYFHARIEQLVDFHEITVAHFAPPYTKG